jgi:hypothetical protein
MKIFQIQDNHKLKIYIYIYIYSIYTQPTCDEHYRQYQNRVPYTHSN